MNKKEEEDCILRYNSRLEKLGPVQKALGWEKERASLRFHILSERWNLSNCSVLDYGCGFGDYFSYLNSKFQSIKYVGVDINSNLIEVARQRYSSNNVQFDVSASLSQYDSDSVDFIFASGVFNFVLEDNYSFIFGCISEACRVARRGIGFNFLSDRVDFTDDKLFYASPTKLLDFAYSISNNVVLRNDYMPYEFTVFIELDSQVDKTRTVYEDYLKEL